MLSPCRDVRSPRELKRKMTMRETPPARILVVDDETAQMKALCDTLRDHGYDTLGFSTARAALEALRESRFDLLLSDLMMPEMNGITLLGKAQEIDPNLVGIIMTGQGTISTAVEAMKTGAFDYVLKPFKLSIILPVLSRALAVRQLRLDNLALQDGLRKRTTELEAANRELRETQAQLVQSAKMASLGQLVAGVAHEINNPLAFVMNHRGTVEENLGRVLEEIEPGLSAAARARVGKIRQRLHDMQGGLERIEDLVAKLRTFSRLDEGEFKRVNIEEGIESVLGLLQHRIKKGIKVTKNFDDRKYIYCMAGPLNQVIMNIMSNAIDAINGRGNITITTGQSDSMFVLSIADDGEGIPEAVREHIFDPFFTTKPVGEGTGLGLSISYSIVKRHNGTIEVRSREGKGTEVIIRLPLTKAGAENAT